MLLAGLAACYQPQVSADHIEPSDVGRRPDAGAEDDPTPTGGLDAQVASSASLTFRVLTAPLGGRYAPKNIGAIWIEDSGGRFVKTLALWASPRKRYLRRFMTASGGDVTDAVTSATLNEHVMHEANWNLRDLANQQVAPGEYQLVIETTDRDASGDSLVVPFTWSDDAFRAVPDDTAHYLDMSLTLE